MPQGGTANPMEMTSRCVHLQLGPRRETTVHSRAVGLDGGVQGSLENSDRGKGDFCFVLLFTL